MRSQRIIARTFGIFFLIAFASYGVGSGLAPKLADVAGSLVSTNTNSTLLVTGVIFMALVHTIVNIGLPVLMQPMLKPFNRVLSYGYLSAGIAATVTLIIGAIFLLMFVPLSSMYAGSDIAEQQHYETLGTLLIKGNFYAYQIGMAIWGFGGLMFCYMLYVSKLVPRLFAVWGLLGYLVFIAGTVIELYGYPYGVELALPGGLFEISLSIYLMVKGFRVTELRES